MIDNRFEILKTISSQNGENYCHAQDYLDCDFVLKILNPQAFASSQEAVSALRSEQKLCRLFEGHPHIAQSYGASSKGVYERGDSKGVIMYSIHEYCTANSLSKVMGEEGPLSTEFAMKVFTQLLSGLKFLHDECYAHLNLCLDNICLDQDFNAKLAKAEKAQYSECEESEVKHKTGISFFRAPEMEEDYDDLYDPFMADIYSLAICIYVMITGEKPSDPHLQRVFYDYDCAEEYEDYLDFEKLTEKPGFERFPSDLKALLCEMTAKEPINRPSVDEIMRLPFMK